MRGFWVFFFVFFLYFFFLGGGGFGGFGGLFGFCLFISFFFVVFSFHTKDEFFFNPEVRCSSAHGANDRPIDPFWWTH